MTHNREDNLVQNQLKEELEKAVATREAGKLAESRKKFKQLLAKVRKTDFEYPTILAEYVIQLRLEAKTKAKQALEKARELENDFPNNPAGWRAAAHSLTDLGGWEAAEPLLKKLAESWENNSLKRGEAQAHLAVAWLRMGKVKIAEKMIKEALSNIRKNNRKENYLEVRETYALMAQALIDYSQGRKKRAKMSVEEALRIAKEGKAEFRIKQARELLQVFK